MTLFYSFKIAGVEIGRGDGSGPNLVLLGTKIDITRDNTNGNIASIVVPSTIETYVDLVAGQEVVISRGETTAFDDIIFRGNIKSIEDNDDDTYTVTCTDPLQKLKYDLFIESYDRNIDPEAGELSEIFKDIAEQGGFTVSRVRSGTGTGSISVDKFISKNNSRLNRMNLIQKILNWVFYYDYNKDFIRLEPKGYTLHPTQLVVGTNIVNLPIWEENIEPMRNKITVEGASQLDTRVDTFTGDGSTTEFELTFTPESVEVTVNGTLKKLGIPGANTTYDYSIDKELKTITFKTAPANTTSIIASYTTYLPTPVEGEDSNSISTYGLTQHEVYTFKDVVTIEDAELRVSQLLEILSAGELSTVIQTTDYSVKVGSRINFANTYNNRRDGEYVVESKVINYGESFDVLKIGTPKIDLQNIYTTIDERLKLLEGSDSDLSTILRILVKLTRTKFRVYRKTLTLEYRDMANSFIVNHQTLGFTRDSFQHEADCSNNGNHGTWTGTDTTTGGQFEVSSESGGVITTPLQNLSCGLFNGTDQYISTSGVSEIDIQSISFFCIIDTNSRDVIELATGKVISVDSGGSITTSGLTGVTITETATANGTHVYIEFDPITLTNPKIGYSTTYFDGKLDEVMIFNTLLSTAEQKQIRENDFYRYHEKFSNLKLWYSFDNPLVGDNRTNYVTEFSTDYEATPDSSTFPLSFPITFSESVVITATTPDTTASNEFPLSFPIDFGG